MSRPRVDKRCRNCGGPYRPFRHAEPFVCEPCEPAVTVTALLAVLDGISKATSRPTLCRIDGCLLLNGEQCPVCLLKARRRPKPRTAAPAGWVRKGLIYVKEVA